jgi:RNA polymerase sigma-70 factor (ECF subfamily)
MILETDPIPSDLLPRIGYGDESALQELQIRTRTRVAYRIRRIVKDPGHAEEVLQDVYTYIWLHASDYRGERGTPWSWICMLARSRALDRFRQLRRESAETVFDEKVRPPASRDSVPEIGDVWKYSRLQASVLELPADQKHLIRMAFFHGFTHLEIALRTGVPLGTVKTRIRVALLRLREKLRAEKRLIRAA